MQINSDSHIEDSLMTI